MGRRKTKEALVVEWDLEASVKSSIVYSYEDISRGKHTIIQRDEGLSAFERSVVVDSFSLPLTLWYDNIVFVPTYTFPTQTWIQPFFPKDFQLLLVKNNRKYILYTLGVFSLTILVTNFSVYSRGKNTSACVYLEYVVMGIHIMMYMKIHH